MGRLSMVRIEAFLFDDDNEDKFAMHGLTVRQVGQILDEQFVVVPNRQSQRAVYLVLGRDYGGTCIAVPIEPTHDPFYGVRSPPGDARPTSWQL